MYSKLASAAGIVFLAATGSVIGYQYQQQQALETQVKSLKQQVQVLNRQTAQMQQSLDAIVQHSIAKPQPLVVKR